MKQRRPRALLAAFAGMLAIVTSSCVQIASPEGWPAPVLGPGGGVLVYVADGRVVAVDPDNGSEIWRFPEDLPARDAERIRDAEVRNIYATPVVNGNTAYLVSYEGVAIRLDEENRRIESPWLTVLGERVVATPVLDGDRLYVATERGRVIVIDSATGAVISRHRASEGRIWGQPVLRDDILYLSDLDERSTVAINVATGARLWEQGLTAASASDLLLDGDLLIVGSFDRALHALDVAAGGDERWRFRGDGWFVGPPATNTDVRYAASMRGSVYAIGPGGEQAWQRTFEEAQFRASPILAGDILVVASRDGLIAGLDPENGQIVWDRLVEDVRINAHGRLIESSIFFVTTDRELLRVDPATGSVQRFTVAR